MLTTELYGGTQPAIYIIHENDAWVVPLHAALDALELPYEDLFVDTGLVDLAG